jgi:hypothetical protein
LVQVRPVAADVPARAVRCYLGDGRQLLWTPAGAAAGLRAAVDAEVGSRPVPPALARRHRVADPDSFWSLWTAVEVSCKLRDVPLPVWLRTRGLWPDPGLAVRTFRVADLIVSCGVT